MNRFIFKKPLALLLTIVMLISSALVYVPAFATFGWISWEEVPIVDYTVTEGVQYDEFGVDEINNILDLGYETGFHVLIKETNYDIDWFWFPTDWWWFIPFEWSEFGNVSIDGEAYTELLSTYGLPVNSSPYELIITKDDVDGACTFDDVITKVNLIVIENQAPTTDDESETIPEGTSINIPVLDGDSDPDGEFVMLIGLDDYTKGFSVNGDTVDFVAPENVLSDEIFTVMYTIRDSNPRMPKEATGTITVTVTPVNDDPVAVDDEATFTFGDLYEYNPVDNSDGTSDTDVEGDTIEVTGATLRDPGLGDVYVGTPVPTPTTNNNVVTFVPNDTFVGGTVVIDYSISDGNGGTDDGVITFYINNELDIDAEDDLALMLLSESNTIINVLANDAIGTLTVSVETHNEDSALIEPQHGTVEVIGDTIKYMPNSSYVGLDVFEYKVSDDSDASNADTAFVLVDIRYDEPSVHNLRKKSLTVREGEFARLDLLYRTTIDKNLIVHFEIDSSPPYGMAVVDLQGNLSYHAEDTYDNEGFLWFRKPIYMRYKITMQNDDIYYGYVKIYVNETENLLLTDDVRTVLENTVDNYIPVLKNDIVDEGVLFFGRFAWDADDGPFHGIVTKNGEGFDYTPDPGYVGIDSFRYFVTDEDMDFWHLGDVADVIISVEPADMDDVELPLELLVTNVEDSVSLDVVDLLVNLPNPPYFDMGSLTVDADFDVTSDSSAGIVSASGAMVTYDPNSDLTNVVLKYTITDQFGHVAFGLINVIVFEDASFARVTMGQPALMRINQYSEFDPLETGVSFEDKEDSIRVGVAYNPSIGATIKYQYEKVNFADVEPFGFYDTSIKDLDGNPISIVYFYGNFDVEYWMEDTLGEVAHDGLRRVEVNAQPKISLNPDIDPEDVLLPPHISVLVGPPSFDMKVDFMSMNILDELFGFDYEDYRLDEFDVARDYDLAMSGDLSMYPDMQVKFYLPDGQDGYNGYDISEFWDHIIVGIPGEAEPEGSRQSGVWEDIAYTIYNIRFTLTDSENFESEMTDILEFKVCNNVPELTLDDDFIAMGMDQDFDPMTMIHVSDVEDEILLTAQEMMDKIVMTIDGNPFDIAILNEEGIYDVEFNYEDMHFADADEVILTIHVIRAPEIILDPVTLDMDVNGLFPVFNGLNVNFFDPQDVTPTSPSDGDLDYSFNAYLGTDPTPLGALVQLDEVMTYTITYVATTRVWDDDDWYPVETTETRTVVVTQGGFGNVVYMSDFWKPDGIVLVGDTETVEMQELESRYAVYPILVKYDTAADTYKLVSAVVLEGLVSDGSLEFVDEVNFKHQIALDDIALLNNGDIYGLSAHDVYKYNALQGTFEWKFNVDDEMQFAVDTITEFNQWDYVAVPRDYNFQSMTADEYNRLVIASGYVPVLDNNDPGHPIFTFEHGLVYFTPSGYTVDVIFDEDVSLNVTPQPISETHYIVGLGLVDLGLNEFIPIGPEFIEEYRDFDVITDIAYSSDLTEIYGIGAYEHLLQTSGIDSKSDERFYQLFKIEELSVETDPAIPTQFFIKTFGLAEYYSLGEGFRYKGIATLGDDIFVTKYIDWRVIPAGPVGPAWYETYVDRYQYDDENGFELQEAEVVLDHVYDSDVLDGMFNGALGAASTFTKEATLLAVPTGITSGGTSTVTLNVSPVLGFHGSPIWGENGAGTLTAPVVPTANVIDEFGNMTMIYNSVSGTAETVTITVSIDEFVVSEVISVSNPYVPPSDPQPESPSPPSPPSPTVGVTLDTDAITLDYGETADPEFTSYDFTETVTGTSNKAVTWSLSDDTFATVDGNGVVTAKSDVPVETGDFTITLTVRTVVGGATDTATILFEEQTPLGAIEFFEPYISGYTDGSFRPSNHVTRAEVASMFARILKLNMVTSGSQKFADVSSDHWAYASIQAMYRSGLFSGYFDTEGSRYFDPEAAISRAEIAQVFTNYWNFLEISVTGENLSPIPDVQSDHWASPAINRIFNTGIFTGFDDGTFRPYEPTLRDQIVSMINRLIARPANNAAASKFTDILTTDEHFGDIEAASQTFLKPQGD